MPSATYDLIRPEAWDQTGVVQLPAHGTTVTAEELRVRLVLAADLHGRIEIDGSQVESIGQAVLQLLVAAHAEAESCGHSYSINDPSEAFVRRVTACRLADAIGLDVQGSDLL